jgi:hypothetical protein
VQLQNGPTTQASRRRRQRPNTPNQIDKDTHRRSRQKRISEEEMERIIEEIAGDIDDFMM